MCGFIEVSIYMNNTLAGLLRELKNKGKVQLGNLKGGCGCLWWQSFARAFHLKGQVHRSAHPRQSKCYFSSGACCIVYESNMIMS